MLLWFWFPVIHRYAIDFCVLILCSATLFHLLITGGFFSRFLGISYLDNHVIYR